MNNLRAVFLIIGLIIAGLDVALILSGFMPGVFLIITPIALIGASIYYTLADRQGPSASELQRKAELLKNIRANWIPISVSPDDCEVKSNSWYKEVGNTSSGLEYSGVFIAMQPIAILDAAKSDDGRVAGFESASQSVLVVKKAFDGKDSTLVSHIIPKDATTVSFMLHSSSGFNIYINPENSNKCLFDIFLD